ncbi:pyridoxamine 5'-phosphate oxidase family protein [Laceyella tengchongensis]
MRQLLHSTRVSYLGLVDAEGTYVVPLNYVWYQDAIYFHGSESGRKADALSTATGPLCFTVAQEYGTIVVSTVPAETGTSYTSVMLFGNVAPITDLAEATAALDAMLAKYVRLPPRTIQNHSQARPRRAGSTLLRRSYPAR